MDGELSGSYKSIVDALSLRQQNLYPSDTVPYTEQRARLQGAITKDWFRLEFADEASYFYQSYPGSKVALPRLTNNAAWAADWHMGGGDKYDLYDRLDRLFVQANFGSVEIDVGKQVLPGGVGHIFSAVNQAPHQPFVVVDAEYEMTQDAAVVRWNASDKFVAEARFLPKYPGEQGENFELKAKTNVAGYDVGLTTGRSDDKMFAGLETAGNLGDSVLRGELVGYRGIVPGSPPSGEDVRGWIQALAGYDTVLTAKWSVQVELFYNGFGQAGNYTLAIPIHRSAPYLGNWYAGSSSTYEISPRLKATLTAILNADDPSTLLSLLVSYSLGDNLDLLLGQFVSIGGPTSEFGGTYPDPTMTALRLGIPDLTYAVLKYAF